MEELFDFSRHTYCACIFISKDTAYINIFNMLLPYNDIYKVTLEQKATITYNKQRTKVLSWGNSSIENNPKEGDIQINNFMDGLYHVFTEDKKNECQTKAVSDFLSLAIKELMKDKKMKNASLDSLFYTFVVPSEWEEEIREDLIRPIFIGANLISKEDHKDRLLFVSDLESICYYNGILFERNQNTVMCRLTTVNPETVLVKLDLINTTNTLFDTPDSRLFPKVIHSNSFFITSHDFKNCIKAFLKDKLFPDSEGSNQENIMEIIKEEIYNTKNIHEYVYLPRYDLYINTLEQPIFTDSTKWKLNNLQRTLLKSICPFDICEVASETLFGKVRDILSNRFVKKHKFLFILDEFSFEKDSGISLINWLVNMTECNRDILNDTTVLKKFSEIKYYNLIFGAKLLAQQAIGNSNMHCPPRILSTANQTVSSSVFMNSKPNAIINIEDISFKSTLLSYFLLNNDGSVKEIFDHNYLTADSYLPSLESFFDISDVMALKVKEQVYTYYKKHLLSDIYSFSVNEDLLSEIEVMLNEHYSNTETLSKKKYHNNRFKNYFKHLKRKIAKLPSTQRKNSVKTLFFIHLIYIKKIISSRLLKHAKFENTRMKIGYAFSIEKMILDNIFNSKEDLEELIYKSGLIEKNDEYKKLRIIISGEGVLSIIQQSFNLEFPVKSYFVFAQLHENYIQLTLNQVVTASSLEDKQQETVIIEDKIIFIQNIYESLCLNMWNNLIQDSSLIQLCNFHSRSNNENETFELFSLETKSKFMSNLKRYISENILAANANFQNLNKRSIKLGHSCDCKVYLTVNDFVEILLKPLLKDISCIMLASLINKGLFGHYTNINYHFSLIHFNHNPQLQDIIRIIMKEEASYFNPKRGIDTLCMVIPKLPNQFFQSLLPFLYKGFRKGILYRVYDKGYAIKIYSLNEDEKSADIFLLSKREDKLGCSEFNKTFYVNKPEAFYIDFVMDINEYEISNFLNSKSISKQKINWTSIQTLKKNIKSRKGTAFIITIKSLGYLSLLQLSAREAGNYLRDLDVMLVGNPMTLRRF